MSLPIAFVAVVLIWSTTPLAIQWSAVDAGFGFAVFARMAIGVLLCAALLWLMRIRFPWHRRARMTYAVGGSSIFGAMTLTYWAAPYVHSGLVSVLFGLSPLVTGLGAAVWLQERALTRQKIGGIVLGILGLILIFRQQLVVGPHAFVGVAAVLGAVTLQSLGLVLMKRIGDHSSPVALNLGSLTFALPLFATVWVLTGGALPQALSFRATMAIGYLGVFGSVVGFILYFYLIKHMEASRVALVTLITPAMALWLAHSLNHEPVTLPILIGTGFILLGFALYQWKDWFARD